MEISKREFLRRLGAGGVALAGGAAFGDEGSGGNDRSVRDIDMTHLRRQLVKDGAYIA